MTDNEQPNKPQQDLMPVTQADRDASAALYAFLFDGEPDLTFDDVGRIRRGEQDHGPGVQAFARHAQQARMEERERCAKIADAFASNARTTSFAHMYQGVARAIRRQALEQINTPTNVGDAG